MFLPLTLRDNSDPPTSASALLLPCACRYPSPDRLLTCLSVILSLRNRESRPLRKKQPPKGRGGPSGVAGWKAALGGSPGRQPARSWTDRSGVGGGSSEACPPSAGHGTDVPVTRVTEAVAVPTASKDEGAPRPVTAGEARTPSVHPATLTAPVLSGGLQHGEAGDIARGRPAPRRRNHTHLPVFQAVRRAGPSLG